MKVLDIMTHTAVCCAPETNVASAVEMMWNRNCGMLPVVETDGKLVGIVTDRDICVALGTRNQLAGSMPVREVATKIVHTCSPDEEIHVALQTMAENKVHRLPVVDQEGRVQGVLSMDDILVHADMNKWEECCELSSEDVMRSLKKLLAQQLPLVQQKQGEAIGRMLLH